MRGNHRHTTRGQMRVLQPIRKEFHRKPIERHCRLVQKQNLAPDHAKPGQTKAAFLSGGKSAAKTVAQIAQIKSFLDVIWQRRTMHVCPKPEVLCHRQRGLDAIRVAGIGTFILWVIYDT